MRPRKNLKPKIYFIPAVRTRVWREQHQHPRCEYSTGQIERELTYGEMAEMQAGLSFLGASVLSDYMVLPLSLRLRSLRSRPSFHPSCSVVTVMLMIEGTSGTYRTRG